uniref:Uncharacterized protein n=1 Tax=Curvibacter symbiont subsp. Hydra magnipapillata TaxID=667019 RepID=C9YBP1_CURXX|nr:hypothetical protein Csp_A15420 [Curvibacter putative symbiont of Hydra magnipapillata]
MPRSILSCALIQLCSVLAAAPNTAGTTSTLWPKANRWNATWNGHWPDFVDGLWISVEN